MPTISLDGNTSIISCNFDEPIILDNKHDFEMCLLNFSTYNSIPNISEKLKNNILHYVSDGNQSQDNLHTINSVNKIITFPTGSYEINDINNFIKEKIKGITIKPNMTTLKVEIKSNYIIDFTQKNSIASLLGFSEQIIQPNTLVSSDLPVNIMNVNSIRIKCNIVGGSYENNKQTNIIHEFFINDKPGEKINEIPKNLIYYPVNTNTIII